MGTSYWRACFKKYQIDIQQVEKERIMPSDFTRSPKFIKGALVHYASQIMGPAPNVIVFQFNPGQLTRSLQTRGNEPDSGSVGPAREDVQRVLGPPDEAINLSVELDAADQLEQPDKHPQVVAHGLQPALCALELLLHPSSDQLLLQRILSQAGAAQICLPDVPVVLFVWGPSRVLPVRITSFSVTEEAFDQNLNPIQAKVELGLKVLTVNEYPNESIGFAAYMASLVHKEFLARQNTAQSMEQISGLLPF